MLSLAYTVTLFVDICKQGTLQSIDHLLLSINPFSPIPWAWSYKTGVEQKLDRMSPLNDFRFGGLLGLNLLSNRH